MKGRRCRPPCGVSGPGQEPAPASLLKTAPCHEHPCSVRSMRRTGKPLPRCTRASIRRGSRRSPKDFRRPEESAQVSPRRISRGRPTTWKRSCGSRRNPRSSTIRPSASGRAYRSARSRRKALDMREAVTGRKSISARCRSSWKTRSSFRWFPALPLERLWKRARKRAVSIPFPVRKRQRPPRPAWAWTFSCRPRRER